MIKPWTLVSSQLMVADSWLRLRADRCRRADGLIIEPYYVNEAPDWVCVLPVTSTGKVVLTREYRHGIGAVVTGLPGGVVDGGDPDPEAAANRELLEETGYTGKATVFLGAFFANWTNQTNKIHFFLARDVEKTADQTLDAQEEIEVLLHDLAEVRAPGFFRQAYHITCLHLAEPMLTDRC